MTPQDFQKFTGVSRETLARLEIYAAMLEKWQKAINLVGPATLPDLWRRHMLDSAQLFPLIPSEARRLADLGSGAGFPGLVLAIMGAPDVQLIESDQRKCTFLDAVARETGTRITIHRKRLEDCAGLNADVITARALAPLDKLLNYARPLASKSAICLFLKGQTADTELTEAKSVWYIEGEIQPSATHSDASILILRRFEKEGPQ